MLFMSKGYIIHYENIINGLFSPYSADLFSWKA